jgi:hypothetical protein
VIRANAKQNWPVAAVESPLDSKTGLELRVCKTTWCQCESQSGFQNENAADGAAQDYLLRTGRHTSAIILT